MAVPVFRTVGTTVQGVNNATASQSLSPVAPAGRVVGDLLLCIATTSHNTGACATPSGWAIATGFPKTSGTLVGGRIYVFVRTADGTSADNASLSWTSLTTSTSGSSIAARISAWANATTTQAGTVGTATDAAVTTPINIPTITTTGTHRLVVGIALKITATAQTGTVTNYTERQDFDLVANATDHATYTAELIQAAAGATAVGAITPSSTTSSRVLAISVAFVSDLTALVALGSCPAVSAATLALTIPAAPAVVPLETAAATSSATFALTAETQVPLETAAATSSATLALTAPSTGFSPTDIAGLYAWYDADALGLANNDPVTSWTDASGGGRHATSATPPTFKTGIQNGKPGILFDGTDDRLAATFAADTSRSIFVVGKSTGTVARVIWSFGNANASLRSQSAGGGAAWQWLNNEVGSAVVLGGTTTNTTVLSMILGSASSMDGYVDSAAGTNFDPSNIATTATNFHIGSIGAATFWLGYVFEIVVYDSALGTTDRESVRDYLLAKWTGAAAPAVIPLGTAAAISSATLALTAPATVPLETAAATSSATLALKAPATVTLGTAVATSSATLAVTAGFSPTDIAGLECWLKADEIGLSDGANVTTWQDSHTSNNDATSSTGQTYETNEVGSLPGVHFDGVDDYFTISGIVSNDATRTVFLVARADATGGRAFWMGSNTAVVRPFDSSNWQYLNAVGSIDISLGGTPMTGNVITVRYASASSANVYIDAGSPTTFDPNDSYSTSGLAWLVGASATGVAFQGEIFEVLVYDSALGTTDRESVRDYLLDKWDFSAAAPAVIPLGTAAAISSATLALATPAPVSLGTAAAASSATLVLTAKPTVALQTAAATSSATLALRAPTTIALGTAAAQASATLALTAKPTVVLGTAAAVSSATLVLTAPARVALGTAAAVSSATLALRAQTYVPLGTAAAISTATLSVTAGPGVITAQASIAVSSATLALTARTRVVLETAAASSSATLALVTPSIPVIALQAAAGVSSASLLLFTGTIYETHLPLTVEVPDASLTATINERETSIIFDNGESTVIYDETTTDVTIQGGDRDAVVAAHLTGVDVPEPVTTVDYEESPRTVEVA